MIRKLTDEIFAAVTALQKASPAQYRLLDETPLFFRTRENEIIAADLENYLESVQEQLININRPLH